MILNKFQGFIRHDDFSELAHFVFDEGDEVKLHNLEHQTNLNGTIVKVVRFIEKEHRYVVQTENGKLKVDSTFVALHAKKVIANAAEKFCDKNV